MQKEENKRRLGKNVQKYWRGKGVLGIKGHECHDMEFRYDLEDYREPLKNFKLGYLHLGKVTVAAVLRALKQEDENKETF